MFVIRLLYILCEVKLCNTIANAVTLNFNNSQELPHLYNASSSVI